VDALQLIPLHSSRAAYLGSETQELTAKDSDTRRIAARKDCPLSPLRTLDHRFGSQIRTNESLFSISVRTESVGHGVEHVDPRFAVNPRVVQSKGRVEGLA
jgi:hypothetical protein